MSEMPQFEEHHHPDTVHDHEHWHVTHNFRALTGGFEHLSWKHSHEHDHAEVTHSHVPHEDFDKEHAHEAHEHDHGEPVRQRQPESRTAKKTAAKGGTRKSTKKAAKKTATKTTGKSTSGS